MAVALREEQIPALDPMARRRKRWTRAELGFFEEHDVFAPGDYELIEGELLDKLGKKRPHILG